jgi:hypothetical protein
VLDQNDRSRFASAMANPAPSTRERILARGLALVSQSGLNGVTLGVLAEQVGMSKSALRTLPLQGRRPGGAAGAHGGVRQARIVDPAMRRTRGSRLRELVRQWFGWAQRAGLPGGCPVAAGFFEFDDVEGR